MCSIAAYKRQTFAIPASLTALPTKKKTMKTLIAKIFLCTTLIAVAFSSKGQADNTMRVSPCDDAAIQKLADSIRHSYAESGFLVLREAAITMESDYEIPIIVPMNEGIAYQFVFIGDTKSSDYAVKMYDYQERQVMAQKKKITDAGGNIISCAYTARMSDYHMIKPVQFNSVQKKNLCGYVMLFKKTEAVAAGKVAVR